MKKLSSLIILLFCAFISFAQTFPNNTSQSNASTKTTFLGAVTSLGYQPKQFTDTISANVVPYLKNTPYVIIAIGNNLYMRNGATTQWLFVGGISGAGGTGVDSVVLRNFVLCQWKSGVSTCYNIDTSKLGTKYFITRYVDSSIRNYNTVNGIDSSTILLSGNAVIDSFFAGHTTTLRYKILGRYYTAPYSAFTLPNASVSADKYAVVYADTLGNVGVISGIAANPANIPQVNSRSQIPIVTYSIRANSLTPLGVDNIPIYRENQEWTSTTNIPGGIFNYTTAPHTGAVSARAATISGGQAFAWTSSVVYPITNFTFLKFYIKLTTPFNSSGRINIAFGTPGLYTTTILTVGDGQYGFNGNYTGDYQLVVIPIPAFTIINLGNLNISSVEFNFNVTSSTGEIQFDDIFLQKGGGNIINNTGVTSFNGLTGNVIYKAADTAYANADTTLYQFYDKASGTRLFTLPTYVQYLSTDTCFTLDTVGRRVNIRFNPYCKGSGGGSTDTTSLSNRINLKLNKSDTAAMLSPYKTSYPRQAISLTTTGSGAATYNNSTGIINVPTPAGGGGSAPDSSWVTGEFGIDGLRVGTILNENFPGTSIPTTFTAASPNTTITYNNKVIVSGGNNTANNYLQGVSYYNFDKQKTSITVIPQDRTGTSYGIGLTQGSNALFYNSSFDIRWNLTSGTDSGRVSFNGVYSPNLYFIATDTLLCEYEREGLYQTVSMLNKRTGKKTSIMLQSGWGTGGALRLVFYGGSQHITNVKIESFNLKNTGVAIIGTSISSGSGASSESSTWYNLVFGTNKYRYSNYSHPSITMDKWIVSDWPNLKLQNPKYAFLEIGYNDRRDMTGDSALYKIQVNKILDSLTTYGIIPVLATLTPTILNPGASIDNTSVMLQNLAISRGLKIADVRTPLLNGGASFYSAYNADGVHPSDSGHIVYANAVRQVFNDAFELYVGDSTSHLKVYNLPTGNDGMNFMAVDSKGGVYKVPNTIPGASKFIQNRYNSAVASVAQSLAEIHISHPVISDSALQVNSPYGLRIGFNDGSLTAGAGRKSNINITNTGVGGTGSPQVFDNLTGLRNIKILATNAPFGVGSTTISGDDNLLIQTGGGTTGSRNIALSAWGLPTSGSDNIGIGVGALKNITTGNYNIHIATLTSGGFPVGTSNTLFFGDAVKLNNLPIANGDIVLSTPTAGSTQFWLGGKSDVLTDIYFNIPAPAGYSNSAGASWYLRAGIGTGTAQPGQFIFQHSTPAGSGTAIHTAFTNTLTLARTLVTSTVPVQATQFQTATSVFWSSGTGSPESVVTANVGSMYTRTDGGAGTTLYVKESGTGNTGWIAK